MKNAYFTTGWLGVHYSAHSGLNGINTDGFCAGIEVLSTTRSCGFVFFWQISHMANLPEKDSKVRMNKG